MFRRQFSKLVTSTETTTKINEIVDKIAHLSLLETSQLVNHLKHKLNISETATVQPIIQQATASKPVETKAVEEKTEFNVTLEKIDLAGKAKTIREIKGLVPGMNLVQAKAFVESVPKVIKEKVNKAEAERIKDLFEKIGATIIIE